MRAIDIKLHPIETSSLPEISSYRKVYMSARLSTDGGLTREVHQGMGIRLVSSACLLVRRQWVPLIELHSAALVIAVVPRSETSSPCFMPGFAMLCTRIAGTPTRSMVSLQV